MNRVVITGMGIWSCLGKSLDEVRNSLFEGKSGIGFDTGRKELGYRSALPGILERPQLKGLLEDSALAWVSPLNMRTWLHQRH
jgi:3-oxoacyl-[acyl-carrier-protein] synthase-1